MKLHAGFDLHLLENVFFLLRFLGITVSLNDTLVNEFRVFFCVSSVFVAALWGFEVDVAILSF